MRDGAAGDYRFVVAEHPCLSLDGYAQITQVQSDSGDLLDSDPCCHEFRTIGSCFDGRLFPCCPVEKGLIAEV